MNSKARTAVAVFVCTLQCSEIIVDRRFRFWKLSETLWISSTFHLPKSGRTKLYFTQRKYSQIIHYIFIYLQRIFLLKWEEDLQAARSIFIISTVSVLVLKPGTDRNQRSFTDFPCCNRSNSRFYWNRKFAKTLHICEIQKFLLLFPWR